MDLKAKLKIASENEEGSGPKQASGHPHLIVLPPCLISFFLESPIPFESITVSLVLLSSRISIMRFQSHYNSLLLKRNCRNNRTIKFQVAAWIGIRNNTRTRDFVVGMFLLNEDMQSCNFFHINMNFLLPVQKYKIV